MDRKPEVGDTVYYEPMTSLRGVVTEIKHGIYSVRWYPDNSDSYISFHSEDQLIMK